MMGTPDPSDKPDQTKDYVVQQPEDGTIDAQTKGLVRDEYATFEQSSEIGLQPTVSKPQSIKYFGDYEILGEIARGGMGVVYKARQSRLNRIVAVKMILSGELASQESISRFFTEAQAAATLDHPGIVPVYEIGQHEGKHYFTMGYVEGQSLAQKVAQGPLDVQQAAMMTLKITEAIAYAHSHGVIHRDLKPANVLLDSHEEPKVTDFGLARKIDQDSGITHTGAVMGTPSYMPPEQAAGRTNQVGPRSDVYSLGAILYCLLTGNPPFRAATPIETMKQVLEKEPLSVHTMNSEVPKDLETICHKCLQKDPANRYDSATALALDLKRFLQGEPIEARSISFAERSWRWAKRHPLVVSVYALTFLLCCFALISWTAFSDSLTTRRIGQIQKGFDKFLDAANASDINSPFILEQFASIRSISPEAEATIKNQTIDHFEKLLARETNTIGLTESHLSDLERYVLILESIGERPMEALRARIAEVRSNWIDVIDVRAPFENLDKLMDSNQYRLDEGVIYPGGRVGLIETKYSFEDQIRVEVTFRFQAMPESAFGIRLRQSDQENYAFVIVPVQDPGYPVEGRKISLDWELQLRRGDVVLRSIALDPSGFQKKTIRLIATQEANKFRVELNAVVFIQFENIFAVPSKEPCRLDIEIPSDGGVETLRIRNRRLDERSDPLVKADALYLTGDYTGAAELYEDLILKSDSVGELRDELRYKTGLCRYEVNDSEAAKNVWLDIASKSQSKWSIPATIQLWRLSIRNKSMDEAYDYYLQLATNAQWKNIATLIPLSVREEIIRSYEVREFGSLETLSSLIKDPTRLERVKQMLAVCDLLDNDNHRSWSRRFFIIRQLLILNDSQTTLDLLEKMKRDPRYYLAAESIYRETEAVGLRNSPREALQRIDDFQRLSKPEVGFSSSVLLRRIQVLHELGEKEQVDRLLQILKDQAEKPIEQFDPVFWEGDPSISLSIRRYKLLHGLVEEEKELRRRLCLFGMKVCQFLRHRLLVNRFSHIALKSQPCMPFLVISGRNRPHNNRSGYSGMKHPLPKL